MWFKRNRNMKEVRVLVTGIGAPGAPGIVKCLRKNNERNIYIVGVDMNENASGRRLADAFYKVPSAKDPAYLDTVLDVCKKESVDIIVPLVTKELMVFSQNKHFIEQSGYLVSVMEQSVLSIVNNKANLLCEMRKLGMKTPEFIVCHSADEIEIACKALEYPDKPICIKSTEGNGSRGVRLLDESKSKYDLLFNEKPNSMYTSYHDIMVALRERDCIPEMMVMELLPGEEYGVDALCKNGEVLAIAGRYNYSVNSSIPQGCIIEARKEPFHIAKELINKLNITGNINIDFKYDSQGNPFVIEINPRLSATIVSYCPAGINFPYLQIKNLLCEKFEEPCINYGIKMQRRYNEVFFDINDKELSW